MRKLLLVALLLIFSASAGAAFAEMCAFDVVPAATLLVPYFEVDIGNPPITGRDTWIFIHNAGPESAVGHITFWTDWALPVIDFDVYLTGYDVVTMSLADVFVNGNLPITAHAADDPDDTISPHGDPSWDEGNFPGCALNLPLPPNPALRGYFLDRTQNGHIGYATPDGGCFSERLGPGPCVDGLCPPGTTARGYLTIDVVEDCNLHFPNDPEYFETFISTRNVLWGDVYYVEGDAGGAAMMPMVHVEADPAFDSDSTPTNYTFYGRYTQGLGGIDHREPLATAWGASYYSSPYATSDWIVWRDPTGHEGVALYPRESEGPDWKRLAETQVFCLDLEEDSAEICFRDRGPDCFPLATQRSTVGEGDLAVPFDVGWCRLNLNLSGDEIANDVDFPADPPGDLAQSFVGAIHRFDTGTYTVGGLPTVPLASACQVLDEVIEGPPIFADGFESGDTSRWG